MASLFTDFFPLGGPGTWGRDEPVWYQETMTFADGDTDARAFQSLFGQTQDEICSAGGGRDWVDCINFSTALYGSDLDGNGQYNVAEVRDKHSWINTYTNELEERGANMLLYSQQQSGAQWTASNVDRNIAVALVRDISAPVPVPEPVTLALLGLGLTGLGFARRQKKS